MNNLLNIIPYIDTKKLLEGTILPTEFLSVLHEHGFVYLYNLDFNPINLSSHEFKNIESCARNFFSRPLEEKYKYYIGKTPNHRGYVPVTEKGAYGDEKERIYEAFDMSYPLKNATKDDHDKLRGENLWPVGAADFKDTCERYYHKMFTLGKELLSVFARAFDLHENHFEQQIKHPPAQMRLLHYLTNDTLAKKNDIAMGGHTDYECFTLLYQSSPGIQGYDHKSGQFTDLPVFKNTLLLITGDMMNFMTNGYLKSFYHRVINNGSERFSFPFFMNFDFETEIKVLPKFKAYTAKINHPQAERPDKIIAGHHLVGQLYRDFPYLKAKIDQGDWSIPFEIPEFNLFENKDIVDNLQKIA